MLTKPTLKFVQALHFVVHTPQFKDIELYLDSELREVFRQMVACSNTEQLHALRGRAAALSELLHATTGTQELLTKLTSQK